MMMRTYKILMLLSVTMLMSFSSVDCGILKNNTFTYKHSKRNVIVVFKENKHIEYHNDKKHFIKSDIEWVNDCEYYLIIKESNLPDFPFKMGAKMHILITKVTGDKVYYLATYGDRKWEGRMTKAKKGKYKV